MSKTVIYHNPNCSTSRNTLALIKNSGEDPEVILYLETPPTKDELVDLLAAMRVPPRRILRKKCDLYNELGLEEDRFSDEELIGYMVQYPILIERPIVKTSKGAILCRPMEAVLEVLPNPQQGEFRKENGDLVIDSNGNFVSSKV